VHFGKYLRTHILARLAGLANICQTILRGLTVIRQTILHGPARLPDICQTVLSGLAKLANGECEYSSVREYM
jgi:hypothetical protein